MIPMTTNTPPHLHLPPSAVYSSATPVSNASTGAQFPLQRPGSDPPPPSRLSPQQPPLPRPAHAFPAGPPPGHPQPPPVNLLHPAAASLAYQLSNGFLPHGPFFRQFPPFAPDFRSHFFREDPKPNYSYIGLIAMSILSTKEKKMVLSDIYQWIQENYPYFRSRGPGWRNSIRHNLSLNDCFIKVGRSSNGKGHYWGIHPANMDDFKKGDFRRRRAQRKVRKALGLACPDEEDTPTPSPTDKKVFEWPAGPPPAHLLLAAQHHEEALRFDDVTEPVNLDLSQGSGPSGDMDESTSFLKSSPHNVFHLDNPPLGRKRSLSVSPSGLPQSHQQFAPVIASSVKQRRKCGFDIASLLAPDDESSPQSTSGDGWANHSGGERPIDSFNIDSKSLHILPTLLPNAMMPGMLEVASFASMTTPKFPPFFPFVQGHPGGPPPGNLSADHMQRLIHQSLFAMHRPDQKNCRQSSS